MLKPRLIDYMLLAMGLLQLHTARGQNATIHIAYIYSGGGQYVSSGTIPAVELAVEVINNNSAILHGHQLQIYRGDSQCNRRTSLEEYFRLLEDGPPKIALLGCGCSIATEAVAEVSNIHNITHEQALPVMGTILNFLYDLLPVMGTILPFAMETNSLYDLLPVMGLWDPLPWKQPPSLISYASSASALSDRERFPNFWRTYPSEDNLAEAVMAIVDHYNWTQLKIITQNEALFTSSSSVLEGNLQDEGVFVDKNGTILFDSNENVAMAGLDQLFPPEIRIYLLNMYSNHARRVMCAAARANPSDEHYYPKYAWITLGWYEEKWWTAEVAQDDEVECTDEELERLLQRTVAIQQFPTATDESAATNVTLTTAQYREQYRTRLNDTEYTFDSTATGAYDAVWALALAMDSVLAEGFSLGNFEYESRNVSTAIQEQLNMTDFGFIGVSGEVMFDEDGTRVASLPHIQKYRDSSVENLCGKRGPDPIEREEVAIVNNSQLIYDDCEGDNTTWPGGIPVDGTPDEVLSTILTPIFIIYTILTGCGILFALFCLVFNIVFRKRKIVRLISPNLNYLIILGAIILYSSVIFYVLPSTSKELSTISCHVRLWLQMLGYFICFGTIVAKIWRVYYIFHHPSPKRKRKPPQDWHLLLIVIGLNVIPVIIATAVAIFDEYKGVEVEDKERPSTRNDDKVLVDYFVLVCQSDAAILWIITLYGCLIITQIAAVYFAFRTRKVNIKALNDTKYIAMIIYMTSVIITIMIIGAITLSDFINADAAVFGAGLLIFTTVVLFLVFVPKMVILYKDPKGEKIFERRDSIHNNTLNNMSLTDSERERMAEMEKHCRDLESRLSNYEQVTPLRSFSSKSRLMSSSLNETAFPRSHTLSTSIANSPMHSLSVSKPLGVHNTNGNLGVLQPSSNTTTSHSVDSKGEEEGMAKKESESSQEPNGDCPVDVDTAM